jgi:hypothetical protein
MKFRRESIGFVTLSIISRESGTDPAFGQESAELVALFTLVQAD